MPDHPFRAISALAAVAATLLLLGALGAQQPPAPADAERLSGAGALTNAGLMPGTDVQAVHIRDLRARVNDLRRGCGLGDTAWTDPDIVPGETPIKAVHFNQLRTAIEEAYRNCNRTPPSWTESIEAGITPIRAAHVTELQGRATLPPPPPPPTARYRVTFVSDWSAATHPQDFPAGHNPHYSPLIGSTHQPGAPFWMPNRPASPGMENMAETGGVSPLKPEIRAAIDAGRAGSFIGAGQLNQTPGRLSHAFDVTLEFPHVSLVTMIAPSPDWFLGVYDVPLLKDGQWVERVPRELPPWDAGTDSGRSYTSADADTLPKEPITRLEGFPVSDGGPTRSFGRFVFERIP